MASSPTSPTGASEPSSARMRTTVLKVGTPTERAPEVGSTGARLPRGTAWEGLFVSVRP